jgi:hypothetical protein
MINFKYKINLVYCLENKNRNEIIFQYVRTNGDTAHSTEEQ